MNDGHLMRQAEIIRQVGVMSSAQKVINNYWLDSDNQVRCAQESTIGQFSFGKVAFRRGIPREYVGEVESFARMESSLVTYYKQYGLRVSQSSFTLSIHHTFD